MACSCIFSLFTRHSRRNKTGVANENNNNNNEQPNNNSGNNDNKDEGSTSNKSHLRNHSSKFRVKPAKENDENVVKEDNGKNEDWGYSQENGPDSWGQVYPEGLGQHQSPIDIDTLASYVQYDASLPPLKFDYDKSRALSLFNSGHSFQVKFDLKANATITGGPLHNDKYQLMQFHGHWGQSNTSRGSEHTIGGRSFPAEIHFVHMNKEKYKTIEEAVTHPDGLAVVGVFLKISSNPKKRNEELQNLIDDFNLIDNDKHDIPLDFSLQPRDLLPSNTSRYFTYAGSLTTPPLSECVTWIVMADPVEVSDEQLLHFHELRNPRDGHLIEHNYRPCQPVNDRIVTASFPDFQVVQNQAPISD